jgi:hypothetical protein
MNFSFFVSARHSLPVFIAALCLAGCVPARQYRYLPGGNPVPSGQKPLPAIEIHPGYKLAFIEVKDDGKLHDSKQREEALNLIKKERQGASGNWRPSSVVVIYIHGWRNNADEAPPNQKLNQKKDVEKFKEALGGLAEQLLDSDTPLIGVYIGWRGKTLNLPDTINWVSFWNRLFAGPRVADGSLQDTVSQLINQGNEGRKKFPIRPRVIVVGHSFGARVLEHAEVKHGGIQKNTCVQLHHGRPVSPAADLYLYVNAATSSRLTRRVTNECSLPSGADPARVFVRHPDFDPAICEQAGQDPLPQICQPYPLFVSISSRSDIPTRLLLPIASFRRSASHTEGLNTHRVELWNQPNIPDDALFSFETKRGGRRRYIVRLKGPSQRNNPIWVLRVDGHVIRDHGDIWNRDFLAMLLSLMGRYDVVRLKGYSPSLKQTIIP